MARQRAVREEQRGQGIRRAPSFPAGYPSLLVMPLMTVRVRKLARETRHRRVKPLASPA